jgi:hypothetical protein
VVRPSVTTFTYCIGYFLYRPNVIRHKKFFSVLKEQAIFRLTTSVKSCCGFSEPRLPQDLSVVNGGVFQDHLLWLVRNYRN